MNYAYSLDAALNILQTIVNKTEAMIYLKRIDEQIPFQSVQVVWKVTFYLCQALLINHDNGSDEEALSYLSKEPIPNTHDSSTTSTAYTIQLNEISRELATKDKFFTAARKLSSYSNRSKLTGISVSKRVIKALEEKKSIIREAPVVEVVPVVEKIEFVETDESIIKFRLKKAEEEAKQEVRDKQKKHMEEVRKQNEQMTKSELHSKGAILYNGTSLGIIRQHSDKLLFINSKYLFY